MECSMKELFMLALGGCAFLLISCSTTGSDETQLRAFIDKHLKLVEPKFKLLGLADWNANATGEAKYYDEKAAFELEIRKIYSSKTDFEYLKKLKESGSIKDSLLLRQLTVLYFSYLGNQIDSVLMKQIVERGAAIANTFNTFRGTIDGKEYTDNDILTILKTEKIQEKRKKAWEAGKQVGQKVAPMVIELAKLRNRAARQLGYDNFYVMSLALGEQDEKQIIAIFDELKTLTEASYRSLKGDIDGVLAKRYGIKIDQVRPWHYENPFFQEAPRTSSIDFDKYFAGKKVEVLGKKFYSGINLPADDVMVKSDLYPRKGKYQHAFCTDIDRLGDVRMMLNIIDNYSWMGTMMHELGHAVYSKNVNRQLPFLLRSEAHTFVTEAIAMLMGRQVSNADWLQQMVGVPEQEKESLRREVSEDLLRSQLIFCRWTQVMMRFERALYQNPDQNLNTLWWDLVEEYQLVKRPEGRNEPDWAAKIHIAQYPAYYHNYMLGELTASQILHSIVRDVYRQGKIAEVSFVDRPAVGDYLREKIFEEGAKYRWDDLIKRATGESLSPKYFAEEFVKK
jgi:peptidyl-dipeptidase A